MHHSSGEPTSSSLNFAALETSLVYEKDHRDPLEGAQISCCWETKENKNFIKIFFTLQRKPFSIVDSILLSFVTRVKFQCFNIIVRERKRVSKRAPRVLSLCLIFNTQQQENVSKKIDLNKINISSFLFSLPLHSRWRFHPKFYSNLEYKNTANKQIVNIF